MAVDGQRFFLHESLLIYTLTAHTHVVSCVQQHLCKADAADCCNCNHNGFLRYSTLITHVWCKRKSVYPPSLLFWRNRTQESPRLIPNQTVPVTNNKSRLPKVTHTSSWLHIFQTERLEPLIKNDWVFFWGGTFHADVWRGTDRSRDKKDQQHSGHRDRRRKQHTASVTQNYRDWCTWIT